MDLVGYTMSPIQSLIQGKRRDLSGMENSLIIKESYASELKDKGRTAKIQAEFDLARDMKIIAKGSSVI